MVPPRYGADLVGGAENHLAALGQHAAAGGWTVDVATTCAIENERWRNALPEGETTEQGLRVMRFAVSPRDIQRHTTLAHQLAVQGTLSAVDEAEFMATSVWSEGLQRFIDQEGPGYDAIVFAPYLLGTTFWGAQSWPERTAIMPCLHDEPHAYLPSVQRMLRSVRTLMFNSPGEERLIRRLLGAVPGSIVGMGFDPPDEPADVSAFARAHDLARYVVYAGRLEEGKRVHVAAQYVADFARRHDPDLRLVLIGRGSWQPPDDIAPYICQVGFVSDEDKRAALAGAVALVNPSELESLSLVLLEAWLEGTPAIVAAGSEVMTDHCTVSGGGFTFADQRTLDEALSRLLSDTALRDDMGERGRQYVHREYSWPPVMERMYAVLSAIPAPATS